jgi:zinc D-Ala-D-Ala dipeptidase
VRRLAHACGARRPILFAAIVPWRHSTHLMLHGAKILRTMLGRVIASFSRDGRERDSGELDVQASWRMRCARAACLVLLVSCGICWTAGCATSEVQVVRAEEPLVDVTSAVPGIVVDIRYATVNNFMHRVLYPAPRCLLRESVARRLGRVQADLVQEGLGLKVYDGYRPLTVQKLMWKVMPDDRYVADPSKGSRHNRGAAVDVTLVDGSGRELDMPSAFDDFSERAHRDYAGGSPEARANRERLIRAMEKHGFQVLKTEWWHFDAPGWEQYGILDVPLGDVSTSRPNDG